MKAGPVRIAVLAWFATVLAGGGCAGASGDGASWSPEALRSQFTEANRFYLAGDYEKARDLYRGIADRAESREVQFNLGNCYFRLGQTGRACLAYRRALLADPGMVEARQNLRFLQNKLGYLTFETSGLEHAVGRLTAGQWLWLIAGGGWTLVLGVTVLLIFRPRQPAGGMVLALAICGAMVSAAGAGAWFVLGQHRSPGRMAIVVEDGVVALTGPFPDARAVRSLSPGSEVHVETVRDEWLFVYLPGEAAGWLERRQVEELQPSNF